MIRGEQWAFKSQARLSLSTLTGGEADQLFVQPLKAIILAGKNKLRNIMWRSPSRENVRRRHLLRGAVHRCGLRRSACKFVSIYGWYNVNGSTSNTLQASMLKLQVFAKRNRLVPDNLIGEIEERVQSLIMSGTDGGHCNPFYSLNQCWLSTFSRRALAL